MRNTATITKTLMAFALALTLVPLAACSKQPPPARAPVSAIESLVPGRADLIALVQVARLLNDKDVPDLYKALATRKPSSPPTLEAALQRMQDQNGINLRDFDEAMIFGVTSRLPADYGGADPAHYWAIILKGRIDKDLIASIVARWGLKTLPVSYQGYDLYVNQNEKGAVTIVAENLIAIGSTEALKEVIDVRQGARRPISGKVYDAYRALPDGMVRLAGVVPPEFIRSVPSQKPAQMPGGEIADRLYSSVYASVQDLDLFTLVLRKDEDRFVTDTALVFNNKESAGNLGGPLKAAVTAGKLVPGIPKAARTLLGNLSLKTDDFSLTVKLSLTPQDIAELAASRQ